MRPLDFPEIGASDHVYLLLCAHGLEEEAEAVVARELPSDSLARLSRVPRPAAFVGVDEGQAAVGQLLLAVDGPALSPELLWGLPGIIGAYAFVGAAHGVCDDAGKALPLLQEWVSGLGQQLCGALRLTSFGFSTHAHGEDAEERLPRFRSSLVRDGRHDFRSRQAMVAIGIGVATAVPWAIDLESYDVEVFGVLHGDALTVGLSCAKRGDTQGRASKFSDLPQDASRLWSVAAMRHMRFSIATLLVELGGVGPGEALLDCCGGVGSIPLEAATRIPNLRAVCADASPKKCACASRNVAAAASQGLFASGSSVEVRVEQVTEKRGGVSGTPDMFDVVVTDLPFGVKCRNPIHGGLLLSYVAALLRPLSGRVALISPRGSSENGGVADALEQQFKSGKGDVWQRDFLVRDGNVGGIRVNMILIRRGPGSAAGAVSELTPIRSQKERIKRDFAPMTREVAETLAHCIGLQGGLMQASMLFTAYPSLRPLLDDQKLLPSLAGHPEMFRMEKHDKIDWIFLTEDIYISGLWKSYLEESICRSSQWHDAHLARVMHFRRVLQATLEGAIARFLAKRSFEHEAPEERHEPIGDNTTLHSSCSSPASIHRRVPLAWLVKDKRVKSKLNQYMLLVPSMDLMVHLKKDLRSILTLSLCWWGSQMFHLRKFLEDHKLEVVRSTDATCDKMDSWCDCPCLDEVLLSDAVCLADIFATLNIR